MSRSVLKWKTDRAHESARGDAALGREKTRPDRGCDEQQRNQRSRGGAEQHVEIMPTVVDNTHEFACMSRLCRVQSLGGRCRRDACGSGTGMPIAFAWSAM